MKLSNAKISRGWFIHPRGKKKAVGIYLLLVFGNREDALGGEVKGFIFM